MRTSGPARTRSRGRGYVYQGRFKSVPIQTSTSLIRVCRYIERNALRKHLVKAAEDWAWGSLHAQCNNRHLIPLTPWPIPQPENWIELVNTPQTEVGLREISAGAFSAINRSATLTGRTRSRRSWA